MAGMGGGFGLGSAYSECQADLRNAEREVPAPLTPFCMSPVPKRCALGVRLRTRRAMLVCASAHRTYEKPSAFTVDVRLSFFGIMWEIAATLCALVVSADMLTSGWAGAGAPVSAFGVAHPWWYSSCTGSTFMNLLLTASG